jgi:hypothetical protein
MLDLLGAYRVPDDSRKLDRVADDFTQAVGHSHRIDC